MHHDKIGLIATVTDGEHGSPDLDDNSGIMYLSGHNVKENYIDLDNVRFCSEKLHFKNLRASVKRNSILMSIVGTVGKCSIVNVDILANTDRNVATIKDIDSKYNPFYVSVFLNSLYGKYQTERFSTGNVQPLLNLSQVKCIIVPNLTSTFQKKIEELVLLNDEKREDSKSTYSKAENILLKELGLSTMTQESLEFFTEMITDYLAPTTADNILDGSKNVSPSSSEVAMFLNNEIKRLQEPKNYNPDNIFKIEALEKQLDQAMKDLDHSLKFHEDVLKSMQDHNIGAKNLNQLIEAQKQNINIKSFKDSFDTSGRLDAEYYQPKYEVVIEKIKSYKNGAEPLAIACKLKDSNQNPIEDKEYDYIELSNIGKTGDINGCTTELGKNLPSRARRLVNTNDVIISSIEGSLQSCALVGKEYDNALCSTGFYVINSEKINSETLIVLFKSELMQSIMKQNCSGTILTGMNKNEFQNILVPIIDKPVQIKIAKLIEESFSLKKESEHLLEVAKRAVEIAIEESEEMAIGFINKNI